MKLNLKLKMMKKTGELMNDCKKTELLCPAGSMESVYAAVENGCNSIYIGGQNFSARQYASNFTEDEIKQIIEYCHLRDVKVFIALNILYKNNEISDVFKFALTMYKYGADAFIVQDIGIYKILRNLFENNIKIHASTQMTIHNLEGAQFLEKIGFDRIVLSRELSIDEIKYIKDNINIEIETFIHGALCVCYSGRCLMSSIIGGRSGNRGRCAQPCRQKYQLIKENKIIKDSYLLSPKDMMSLKIIDKLLKSNIDSFKIEGRMKSPEYVAETTKVYRKYIDLSYKNKFEIENSDIKELTQIFNRGGSFSQGYYTNWAGNEMMSSSPKSSGVCIGYVKSYNKKNLKCIVHLNDYVYCGDGIEIWTDKEPHCGTNISKNASPEDEIEITVSGNIENGNLVYKSFDKKLNDKLKKSYSLNSRKQTVKAIVKAEINKPLYIKITAQNGIFIEHFGDITEKAQKQPITNEKLLLQLSKTGNTPFNIVFDKSIIDENIYIPISSINNFRREAIKKLENKIIESYNKNNISASMGLINSSKFKEEITEKEITVQIQNKFQFDEIIKYNIKRIYMEFNNSIFNDIEYYIKECHKKEIEYFVALPRIYRHNYDNYFEDNIKKLENTDIDGYLIRNFSNIKTNKKIAYDYTFNILNIASVSYLNTMADYLTLSPELNISELKELSFNKTEILAYGKITLMTTHQCPVGLYDGNKKEKRYCSLKNNKDIYYLKDKKNILFPVITDCNSCTAFILNNSPIFILNKYNEFNNLNTKYLRLLFTDENAEEINKITYSYLKIFKENKTDKITDILISNMKEKGFTNGHFFRGVM